MPIAECTPGCIVVCCARFIVEAQIRVGHEVPTDAIFG